LVVTAAACYVGWRAIRPEPLTADAIWERAETDFRAARYDRVDAAIVRLSRLRTPTPLDLFLLAQLSLARNQTNQALDYLARVPDQHYMAAQARLLAGQTELRRNRVRIAEELFQKAIALDPKLVQPHKELIYIYGMQLRRRELNREFNALSKLTELTFDNAFHWGLLRNNSWEPGEAVEALARYVAADSTDRASRLALAENYLRMDRIDDAAAMIAPLASDDSEAVELRARIALDREDSDEAERQLAMGAADDPLLARLRGRLAIARGDYKMAAFHYQKAFTTDPENRETIFGLMAALERLGDKTAAAALRATAGKIDRLNTLIQRAPLPGARQDPALMRELGAACAALDRLGEARAWYKLAIDLNPLDHESQQALFRLEAANRGSLTKPLPVPTP
jgi:tetratricopeptide (TPR) repeat protein